MPYPSKNCPPLPDSATGECWNSPEGKDNEKKYFYRCASTDKSENKPLPPILKPFRPHLSLSLSNGKTWLKTLNKKMPYAMKLLRGVRCRIEIIYKMKYGL
jgi:hypothetical protein